MMYSRLFKITFAVLLSCTFVSEQLFAEGRPVLSYKEWKSERIQDSLNKVVRIKSQMELRRRKTEESVAGQIFHQVVATVWSADALEKGTVGTTVGVENAKAAAPVATTNPPGVAASPSPAAPAQRLPSEDEVSLEKLELELAHAQFNLETTKELTVEDYFSVYLSQQEDKKTAFKLAAAKLDAEEIADIFALYEKSISHNRNADSPKSSLRQQLESPVASKQ
jgi:hypothetical protein